MLYLTGTRWMQTYRIVYIIVAFLGCVINLQVVWNLADCMNALMAIPNLVSLILLSGVLVRETKHYLWNDNLDATMDITED